jgi:hypothetical protein
MAQAKRKRTRKHRGTAAGTVERAGRTGRGRTQQEGRDLARQRRAQRLDKQPTWQGATTRAGIAAAVFGVLIVLAFHRPPTQGVLLAGLMFLLYIPLGFATDTLIYRVRQRRKQQTR